MDFERGLLLHIIFWNLLFGYALCNFTYDKVGDCYYFIGMAQTDKRALDWFDARHVCWEQRGQLVAIESAEELTNLKTYMLEKGYPNGSTFFTSGHSFDSVNPFKWDNLQEPVTIDKWLPDEAPLPNSYLGLQLIDSDLYMRRSYGYDQFYICEKESLVHSIWSKLHNLSILFLLFSILFFLVCISYPTSKRRKDRYDQLQKSTLMNENKEILL